MTPAERECEDFDNLHTQNLHRQPQQSRLTVEKYIWGGAGRSPPYIPAMRELFAGPREVVGVVYRDTQMAVAARRLREALK